MQLVKTQNKTTLYIAIGVFITAIFAYLKTMPMAMSFWDCGEYITTSHILGVPHQPGTPLYVLVGRVFDIIFTPIMGTTAAAVNFMSVFFSALALMFVYLIIEHIARKADPDSGWLPHVGGIVGTLFLMFSDTFWRNAIEAEVYGLSAFMISSLTYLVLIWYNYRDGTRGNGLLYLVFYMLGLGVGFHLGSILVYPGIFIFVIMSKDRGLKLEDLFIISFGLFLFLLSTMVSDSFVIPSLLAIYLLLIGWRSSKGNHFVLISSALFLLGISVHLFLMIRAGLDPAINQTQPDNFATLMTVLRREQYPPINPMVRKADFLWQIGYYYNYLMDQFYFTWMGPNRIKLATTFLVPIFLGILGLVHGMWRARHWMLMIFINYLINADILNVYLNFSDHEVRERDYFFFAGFMLFAIFIGIGASAVMRYANGPLSTATDKVKAVKINKSVWALAGFLLIISAMPALVPGHVKWFEHDQTENQIGREYAWNLLAGLDENAIVFTNGDNDTFPVWYLQEVEKFRTDVTVVNLSLINLPWYIIQMMDRVEGPPIPLTYTKGEVKELRAIMYEDPDTGEREIIYVKDWIVDSIINANKFERSVYFAVTIPHDNMKRYFSYLKMEGLAYKLTRSESRDGSPKVDSNRLLANMFGVYDMNASLSANSDKRRASFARLNNLSSEAAYENINEIAAIKEVNLDSMIQHVAPFRTDVFFDTNARHLVGNYPAALIRAGYDFLIKAQKTPEDQIEIYDALIVKAEAAFEMAACFDPAFPMCVDIYPLILVEQGRVDKAISHLELISGEIPIEKELASIDQVISAMLTIRQYEKAEQWMRRRIEKDPQDSLNYRFLFRAFRAEKSIDKCTVLLEEWELVRGSKDLEMRSALEEMRGN
jgi:hypothetical protein